MAATVTAVTADGADVPLAVDILADILTESSFDHEELEREQQVILQEIGQAMDTPDDIIFDQFQEMAYPVKFAGGVSTKEDPKAVPTARLLTLENAVFTRAVSLSKRYGYTSLGLSVLGSATPYALPRGLAARGDELVLFTEAAAYSYVEGAGAWSQIADGMMSIRQSDRALVKTVSSQTGCDYASCDGVAIVAWNDSRGGVWFAVTETNGERVTIPPTQASASGTNPRCVRSGDRLLILWAHRENMVRLVRGEENKI